MQVANHFSMLSQSLSAEGNRNFVGHAYADLWLFSPENSSIRFRVIWMLSTLHFSIRRKLLLMTSARKLFRLAKRKINCGSSWETFLCNLHNWWKSKFLTWKRSLWSIWPTIRSPSAGLYAFPIFHSSLRRFASSFMMRKKRFKFNLSLTGNLTLIMLNCVSVLAEKK